MINTNLIQILSDLFINLAAGWLGVAIIVPLQKKDNKDYDWVALIINLGFSIVSLVISYYLVKSI